MDDHRLQKCSPIDSRLLQEMIDAGRCFRLSRGGSLLEEEVNRYITALHRFTDRALRQLPSGPRGR